MKKILIGLIAGIIIGIVIGGCIIFILQTQQKVYRIGILSGLDLFSGIADSFKDEMTVLGYKEGKNVIYHLQKTNFEHEKEQQILKKFVIDKVDLIFGYNTEVAIEAKAAAEGTGIPVVFANSFIEGNNLVKSINDPGGNITGVRFPGTDVAVKRLEILHELAPHAKRFWLPYQKGYPPVPAELEVVRPAAAALNLTLTEFAAENTASLRAELERRSVLGDIGFDAVLFIPESLSTTKAAFEIIAEYTRARKIPVGGSRITTQDYGTVFALMINNVEVGKSAAHTVDKILKGASAGSIPVISSESHFIFNYKVAEELGLVISEGLLSRADEIIR